MRKAFPIGYFFCMATKKNQVPIRRPSTVRIASIERSIYFFRGLKVMLDVDLARLYRVATSRLNEQVKRNRSRFPKDFMFQLTAEEAASLTSQIAISKSSRGGRRHRPYAFTEQGVAMLSSVLKSGRAVQVKYCHYARVRKDTRDSRHAPRTGPAPGRTGTSIPTARCSNRRSL